MTSDRLYRLQAAAVCFLAAMGIAVLVPPPARAASIPMSPALQKVIDGAKKEGKLTLSYAANILGGAEGARRGAAGIKQMFGVDLDVTYYPGPSFAPMAAKLVTERQAGQPASTDVYNGTAVEITPQLANGLFRQIPWTELYPGRITPEIAEADGRALRIVTKIPGILFNNKVAPEFAQAHAMADLLKPEYKGKLYTTPYLAGFDVLVAKDMWGFDKTAAFVRQFSQNIGGLVSCAGVDRIASGEIPALALSCSGSEANLPKYGGVLGQTVLLDAATRRFDYLCVPVNAAHPNAAILFALYASSPEGQIRILHDGFGSELDTYPDTPTHRQIVALQKEGAKFTDVTIAWWLSHPGIDADLGKLIKIVTKQ
ncbi:MAG TPA: extracellular solute-binding protein [Stellaceae bacterium]|nr:extracellular solute-binding protein [Stellaceae bacterium]